MCTTSGHFGRISNVLVYLFLATAVTARADIVLGQSSDFSSPNASLTRDYMRGMNAYLDDINKKGGVRGEKVRIVSLDDGGNPEKTAENTKKLIEEEGVTALVAYRGTAGMLKVVPLIQAAGVAQIGSTSMAKQLREPYVKGVFHMRPTTADEIEAAVNHAATLGITRIAAYYQDDAFGAEAIDAFKASLAKRSLQPAGIAVLQRGSTDVASGVDTISRAQPQAVMMLGQMKPNAAFIKGMRAKGSNPMFFALSVSSGLHAELKEAAAGVMVTQVAPYPFIVKDSPVVAEYQALITDKKYSYNSIEGYLNAKLVVRALQKTPAPVTRAKLMATLETLSEDLGGFHVAYAKDSNRGSRYVNLTMIRSDGTFAR